MEEAEDIMEKAYEKIEQGFPARFVASRSGIDCRKLFKLERERKHNLNVNFDNFISWLLENESDEFKTKFDDIMNKVDYRYLTIPQYWFISIYIFLKNKENRGNKIYELLFNFNISAPTWRKYKKEILKVV